MDDVDAWSGEVIASLATRSVEFSPTYRIDSRAAKPLSFWETQDNVSNATAPYISQCDVQIQETTTFIACPSCNAKRSDSILKTVGACPSCQSKSEPVSRKYCTVTLTTEEHVIQGKAFGGACYALLKLGADKSPLQKVFVKISVSILPGSMIPSCTVLEVMADVQ